MAQPLLAGGLRSAFSMTEPATPGRTHPDRDHGRPATGKVGPRRPQVVHLERVDRRLPHRHGRHRPGRAAAPPRVDVRRSRGRPGVRSFVTSRRWSTPAAVSVLGGHSEVLYEGFRLDAAELLGGVGDGFLIAQIRLGPGGSITACAGSAGSPRLSTRCASGCCTGRSSGASSRTPTGPVVDRRHHRGDAGGPADDPARGLGIDHRGVERGAHRRLDDQVLRRQGAPRRRRPGGAGPRRARVLRRPSARDAVPVRPPLASSTAPTRSTGRWWRGMRCARIGRRMTGCRASISRPAARRRCGSSPT